MCCAIRIDAAVTVSARGSRFLGTRTALWLSNRGSVTYSLNKLLLLQPSLAQKSRLLSKLSLQSKGQKINVRTIT